MYVCVCVCLCIYPSTAVVLNPFNFKDPHESQSYRPVRVHLEPPSQEPQRVPGPQLKNPRSTVCSHFGREVQ